MIHLTRINRVPLVLNSDLIEHVEATPDTVISLTTGQKIRVLESPAEVVERVIQFRRSVLARPTVVSRTERDVRAMEASAAGASVPRPD
jgi:flagellar protein FlbD